MIRQVSRAGGAAILLFIIGFVGPFGAADRAQAAPYAAAVLDMRTGEIVHSRGADRRQHPASLTKLMTLYLTFEALELGQIGLDQRVRVSARAARQPASKLYLRAGQRVSIRSLIRATAIKSANDAAMVLAEAIAGSKAAFAGLMTAKAKALGMTRTRFRNPHGLTQRGHLSTARDMARLARRLYFDFPEYYNIFGRRHSVAAGKRVNTTNRLLASYRGAEGMKTGYTSAAGYNLIATAKRGPRRVLAVLLGGRSSGWRYRRMRKLLDMGFKRVPRHAAEIAPADAPIRIARAPLPQPRPGTRATGFAAIAEALSSQAVAAVPEQGSDRAPLYATPPAPRPGSNTGLASAFVPPAAPAPSGKAEGAAAGPPVPVARPGWAVQLGAFRRQSRAEASLSEIDLAAIPTLTRGSPNITESRSASGKAVYKVRVVGLDRREARRACTSVREAGGECLAIAPR